jgi:hypothetical protein
MRPFTFFAVLSIFILSGCLSSVLVVGNKRPETDPATIKVYLTPPKHFEQIALVNSDDNGKLSFTKQGKLDTAVKRAKKAAAKLGANGILLNGVGSESVGGVTIVSAQANGNTLSGFGTTVNTRLTTVSVVAIWVTEE